MRASEAGKHICYLIIPFGVCVRLAAEEEGYDNAMEVEEDDSRGRGADYSYSSFGGGDSSGDNKAGQTGGSRGNSSNAEKKRGSVSV